MRLTIVEMLRRARETISVLIDLMPDKNSPPESVKEELFENVKNYLVMHNGLSNKY